MPGLSKVIVLDPDARAGRQIQLGFEREGVPVARLPVAAFAQDAKFALPGDDTGLVMVGGGDGAAVDLVRRTRGWLDEHKVVAPLVFAGRGVTRADARAAGADEVVDQPAYLRDVVTIGRLLRGRSADQRTHLVGNLMELAGVFTLVRALAALGRSATLTLVRGLRRGEIRFYHGEVTSAQVGMIHGQAALHQLLLWTDARFDYHHEDIVRRHQIPLEPDELFADAERFLEGVRDASGGLSPSMILEQNVARVQSFGKQVPSEVYGVLRMFDGYRVLADVLEDSAYRVFETLRVAQRAVEIGLLRVSDKPKPKPSWRPMLAMEDWLVGRPARDLLETGPIPREIGPIELAGNTAKASKKSRRNKKPKKRTDPPAAGEPVAASGSSGSGIDWDALVPRRVGAEVGSLSGVVPAAQASGEIAGGGAIDRQLPDAGPKVVFDEARERAEAAERQRAAVAERERQAAAAAKAKAEADEEAAAAKAKADEEDKSKAEAEVKAKAKAEANARAEAEATAQAKAQAETDAKAQARAEADAAAQAKAEQEAAAAKAEQEAAAAKAKADADAAAKAKAEQEALRIVAETVSLSQEPSTVVGTALPFGSADGRGSLAVDDLSLDDTKRERLPRAATIKSTEVAHATIDHDAEQVTEIIADEPPESQLTETEAVTISETDTEIVVVHDRVVVDTTSATTVRLVATQVTEVRRAPTPVPVPSASAPAEVTDAPSDGVIIQHITTADTAPVKRRRRPPSDPVEDDRPGDATGEITMPRARSSAEPRHSEPSILISDLAAIHDAVSEVASGQVTVPTKAPSRTADPAAPERNDHPVGFSDLEEEFFRAGHDSPSDHDSFSDLDEGYRKVSFWDRLRGRVSRLPDATEAEALAARPAVLPSATPTVSTSPLAPALRETTKLTEPPAATSAESTEPATPAPAEPSAPKPAELAKPTVAKPAAAIQPRPPSKTQQTIKGRPDQQRKPGKKKW